MTVVALLLGALAQAAQPSLDQLQPPGPPAGLNESVPAAAPVVRGAPGGDRFQTLDYEAGRVFPLGVAAGYQLTIALAPDEKVQSVALGDSANWAVNVDRGGNHLFVKLAQEASSTNMTVITNVRVYAFDLRPVSDSSQMPYSLHFNYPTGLDAGSAGPRAILGRYDLSGARNLRPSAMSDDGVHVFIQWPGSADLPAVYAVDARGQENLVNGAMRGDQFVVDGVAGAFVFRIDQQVARAKRVTAGR